MYGMVNKAVEDMVCTHHGEQSWERIKAVAGVDVDVFISNEPYPDCMTHALVREAESFLICTMKFSTDSRHNRA